MVTHHTKEYKKKKKYQIKKMKSHLGRVMKRYLFTGSQLIYAYVILPESTLFIQENRSSSAECKCYSHIQGK